MNPTTARSCIALLALGLGLWLPAPAAAQDIAWRTDYNRARQEASESGRPIVIDFTTDNCYWCRQLESRTFVDPDVARALSQRCIPLRVDASKHPHLARALNIQSYPTLVYASPDGKILGYHEGFLEAPALREHLRQLVSAVADPDWMVRDYTAAAQAHTDGDYPRTVSLLRHILEDGRERPLQVKARKLLGEVEAQAAAKLREGRDLIDQGRSAEGFETVRGVVKNFRGTPAASEGDKLLVTLASRTEPANPQRARTLLAEAREDYRSNQLVACIDRCEVILAQYGDTPEAAEARELLAELRADPDLARKAAEQMADRLGSLYLSLAEGAVQRGQTQQAVGYLERVVASCPNTRHAETAQDRLNQLKK